MEQYRIKNEDRILEFTGELIGHATSHRDDSLRWLEVNVYRTEAGGFVYETVGHSRVWRPSVSNNPKAMLVDSEVIDRVVSGARQIDPKFERDRVDIFDYEGKYVILEENRHRATYSKTAEGAVETAKVQDPDGVLFLTNTAKQALREASRRAPELHSAFAVDRVA